MIKLNPLESAIIRLNWVTNRLEAIVKKFPIVSKTDKTTKKFQGVLREYIIIQLHNFIQIRKDLRKNPNLKLVDNCLQPLWQPIDEVKTPIKKLRNKYLAHIQDSEKIPFDVTIEEITEKYQLPTTFGFWLYLSYCEILYALFLEMNFQKDFDSAQKKYRVKIPLMFNRGTINLNNFREKTNEALELTQKNLDSHNFKSFKNSEKPR